MSNMLYFSHAYLYFLVVVERIDTDRIDMREHVIDLCEQRVITKDTVAMDIDALVVCSFLLSHNMFSEPCAVLPNHRCLQRCDEDRQLARCH